MRHEFQIFKLSELTIYGVKLDHITFLVFGIELTKFQVNKVP